MQKGLFARLITALGHAFGDIADFFGDADSFQSLVAYLGWPGATLPSSYQALVQQALLLRNATQAMVDEPDYADIRQLTEKLVDFINALEAVNDVPSTITDPDFLSTFKQQLIGVLVVAGIEKYFPAAYYLFSAIGIVTATDDYSTADTEVYQRKGFNLTNFKALLSQPARYLSNYLGWGATFALDNDLQNDIVNFIAAVGGQPSLLDTGLTTSTQYDGATDPVGRGLIYLPFTKVIGNKLGRLLSVSLVAQEATSALQSETYFDGFVEELAMSQNPDLTSEDDISSDDAIVSAYLPLYDELILNLLSDAKPPQPIDLGNHLSLMFEDLSNALKFRIGSDGINFADGDDNPIVSLSLDPAVALNYTPPTPIIFIGEPNKTRLQADGVQLALALSVDKGVKLELKLVNSQLIIKGSEGDSFLSSVLPDSNIAVPLSVTLSSADGLRFNGANSFRLKSSPHRAIGPVLVDQLTLGLESTAEHDVAIRAHSDLVVSLGPVKASASDVGVSFTIKELTNPKDIALGFDLPKGIGIDVNSDLVTGGGYLFLDPAHHKYAGAASLKLKLGKSDINLNALGLLQTELPGRPDAYSLLLLITATFTPIELGLGFTLNGLGGLLGINRAADTAYLRGLVRQGQLDKLLFPANVMDNPADALATVDQAFPATEGRYIIGLMGRLGWGVPTSLLTLDVALLVELPSPVRLLILGVLQASLPSKTNELLKLRADFLGSIDFGAKKVAFDAALSESKLLVYSLTGDMAFRLYQGDNPVFLISAGGFHPSFQPPAGADLPAMRRLTLALAQGNNLRLTLASYFAVTSNTVQFGAQLDFYFNLRLGLHVEGRFGLDTLFQFSPFRLLAHMEAGVAIKRGNSELLGIHLSLDVTGPGPWHIWGEASFKIWFVKISVDVDGYIGSAAPAPALPAPDVRTPLVAALAGAAAWTVEAPATAVPGGVVLRPADVAAGQLFLDPRGTLVVSQRVAPLSLKLDRYGNGAVAPTGGNYFELLSLTVSGGTLATTTTYPATDANHVEEAREFFAPDQFRNLSQAERLSLPSFQRLPNGLRLKNLSRLTAGRHPQATRRVVQYERLLRDGAATGTAGGGSLTPLARRYCPGPSGARRHPGPAPPGRPALGPRRPARGLGRTHLRRGAGRRPGSVPGPGQNRDPGRGRAVPPGPAHGR